MTDDEANRWRETTVTIRTDDALSSIAALQRWAKQCVPGSDRYLNTVVNRINESIRVSRHR